MNKIFYINCVTHLTRQESIELLNTFLSNHNHYEVKSVTPMIAPPSSLQGCCGASVVVGTKEN
jgi:hypothetical protein